MWPLEEALNEEILYQFNQKFMKKLEMLTCLFIQGKDIKEITLLSRRLLH